MKARTLFRIAIILPLGPEYAGRLLEGAIGYAQQHPDVQVLDRSYLREGGDPSPARLLDVDGALVWVRRDERWVNRLIEDGVTVVNTSSAHPSEEIPLVIFDGFSVVDECVAHFQAIGCREGLYVGAAALKTPERFLKACAAKGITADILDLGPVKGVEDQLINLSMRQERMLSRRLKEASPATAVWCDNDFLARIVCDKAIELGLRIPEDLAVLGVNDYRIARIGRPTISTIPLPGQLVARRALQWIHESLKAGRPCEGQVVLPSPSVVVRETTRRFAAAEAHYHRAHSSIQEHACSGLTVNELMQGIPLSQRTFSKRFAELYGATPGVTIRRVRADRAKELLSTTNLTIARIASLCGFEEPSKFSTFFKSETGTTPRAYRHGNAG